ncbi:MAG: hypothetical protein ACI4JD_08360 [Ruminococcus sp.]
MKHNWKKQYLLQEISLDKDVSAAVRERALEKMKDDTQKGKIIMNVRKKKRTAVICAAAVSLLFASAIGIHAAANSELWKSMKIFVNGEELTASVSQEGNTFYCEIEGGDYSEQSDVAETETTFYIFEDPDTDFFAECDAENRLWLKATTDDDFAIDITDELVRNGSYTVTCICGNDFTKAVTVQGSVDDYTLNITPIDTETVQSVDVPIE